LELKLQNNFSALAPDDLKRQMKIADNVRYFLATIGDGIKCTLSKCILPWNQSKQKTDNFGRTFLVLASGEDPGGDIQGSHTCWQGNKGCFCHVVSHFH
jgi:hypothetical protein